MRFYLSHPIRGKAGPDASHNVQNQNCKIAIEIANALRQRFPKLELYVPAEHETFIQIAYDSGHLSEKDILDIDCHIIDGLDGVLIYVPKGDKLQGGRLVEYKHAIITNKPRVIFENVDVAAYWLTTMYRGKLI